MKIIKLNKNYDLGEILAKIRNEEENSISIETDVNDHTREVKKDLAILKEYAGKLGKSLNITENTRFKKVGFVSNEDVTELDEPIQIERPKTKRQMPSFSFFKKLKKPNFTGVQSLFPIAAVALIIGAIIIYISGIYFLPKAVIEIKLDPKAFSVSEELTATTDKNALENAVAATKVSLNQKDTSTAKPTGEKETGDTAKGKVKIYNKTDKDVTLKKGQILSLKTDSETLNYLLSKDTTVDKKTTQDITDSNGNTTKADVFGSSEAEFNAESFGTKYNIDKKDVSKDDLSLKSKDKEDFEMEVTTSFTGGSSRKITVALQNDLDSLKDSLTKDLEQRAISEMKTKSSNENYFAEGAYVTNVKSAVFNVKADEETEQIDLEMELELIALSINKNDLIERLKPSLKKLVPDSFDLSSENTKIDVYSSTKEKIFNPTTKEFTGALLVNRVQTYVIPRIDSEKIKSDLSGVEYKKAIEYLGEIEGITGSIKQTGAKIPFFNSSLPKNKNNISVEVSVNENL